jgi:hypothetical protein
LGEERLYTFVSRCQHAIESMLMWTKNTCCQSRTVCRLHWLAIVWSRRWWSVRDLQENDASASYYNKWDL